MNESVAAGCWWTRHAAAIRRISAQPSAAGDAPVGVCSSTSRCQFDQSLQLRRRQGRVAHRRGYVRCPQVAGEQHLADRDAPRPAGRAQGFIVGIAISRHRSGRSNGACGSGGTPARAARAPGIVGRSAGTASGASRTPRSWPPSRRFQRPPASRSRKLNSGSSRIVVQWLRRPPRRPRHRPTALLCMRWLSRRQHAAASVHRMVIRARPSTGL